MFALLIAQCNNMHWWSLFVLVPCRGAPMSCRNTIDEVFRKCLIAYLTFLVARQPIKQRLFRIEQTAIPTGCACAYVFITSFSVTESTLSHWIPSLSSKAIISTTLPRTIHSSLTLQTKDAVTRVSRTIHCP